MIPRLFKPSQSNSFFLLGARGTGKSTLLKEVITPELEIDLLLPSHYDPLLRNPEELLAQIRALQNSTGWVVVDEVQKLPGLLDIVHHAIEKYGTKFALTGSSARKLRRGQANLLAGRAYMYHLFPLTHREIGTEFDLTDALSFGTLPKVHTLRDHEERNLFLEAYAHTYLREEIQIEQTVRLLPPFRKFLEIAAQMSGSIINFSRIAREVGVDSKTAQSYFQILEDTLLGFFLPAYHQSLRKTQLRAPRFFLFDNGVKRALEGSLKVTLLPSTSAYGVAFEAFVINELIRLNAYLRRNFKFSFLATQSGGEVDVVIERPGQGVCLVEIKSTTSLREEHVKSLLSYSTSFKNASCYCLSRDPTAKRFGPVLCLPWERGLEALGLE
jgi:uncharacterized protein